MTANQVQMTANQVQIRCKIRWLSTRVLPRIYRVLTRNHRVLPRNYRVLLSIFSSVDSATEFLLDTRLPFSQHWCSTYCLSCSGTYLNLLTSRRILTAHLHVLEGITQSKQWVVIGSATNATKEAVVTRTILVWHLLRRKLQPMHRMQFRLFSLSQHRR
jgi:hypothetical protein